MKNRETQQGKESSLLTLLLSLIVVCLLSGGYALLASHSTLAQVNVLLHVVAGVALTAAFVFYLAAHFKRALGIRKPAVVVTGFIATVIIAIYLYTGWILAISGHTESGRQIGLWHAYGALALVAFILLHFLLHKFLKYRTRRDNKSIKTYDASTLRHTGIAIGAYIFLVTAFTLGYNFFDAPLSVDPLTKTYDYSYGPKPFWPSQTETSTGTFIHEKEIAGSEQCAACHQGIAKQWYSSIHRQAASDPTYVRNVTLLNSKKGIAATRYCEGCHAPIALLTGQLTPGGKHAGIAGTTAHIEGVGCLGCHGISDTVHLNGVASYVYTPPEPYLFGYSENSVLRGINQYITKISAEQHRVDMSAPVLSDPRHCATCHAQFMDKDMNGWGWVKMQDDYSAWLNSPYSQQHEQAFAAGDVTRCHDCHMPLVQSSDPSANADGMVRSHRFLAANTMAPFLSGDKEHLRKTQEFLQSNKMRVTIEKPNRPDAIQSSLNIQEDLRFHSETPYYYYLGEDITLEVVVSNVGVGHDFPGGTADINEPWIELLVKDAAGETVFHSGFINADGSLDSEAHAYVSKKVDRHGNLVWKHDLFNMTGEAYKNVIKAGQSDVAKYTFAVPAWVKGPLIATATLKYRKLNNRYARWALEEKYRDLPITDMARDSLVIDIYKEKKVLD